MGREIPGPGNWKDEVAPPPNQTDGAFSSRVHEASRSGVGSLSGEAYRPAHAEGPPHTAGVPVGSAAACPSFGSAAAVERAAKQEVPEEESGTIHLNLSAILAGVPAQILGFNALQVPATITTQLPLGLIKAQLAAGNVRATVNQIMQGCDPVYQPAFARANLAHEVSLPLQEIFHNLPADDPGEYESQGDTSSLPAGASSEGPGQDDADPAAEDEGGYGEFLTASTGVPRNHDLDDERVFSALFEQAVGSDSAMGGEPEPLESLDAAEFSEQGAVSSDGLSSGDFSGAVAGERHPADPLDGDDLSRNSAASDCSRRTPAAGRVEYEFGFDEGSAESALNSILMTDEELSVQRVAELASEFPGIGACCILSAAGRLLGGNLPHNVEARVFEAMAPRLHRNFQELSGDLGLGNAEIFTVHTDRGTVSFFTTLSNCLVVLHSRRDFVPGVREKLISIAFELRHLRSKAT